MRHYSLIDSLIFVADNALKTLSGGYKTTLRPCPADDVPDAELEPEQIRQVAGLMRINHCGEVCAQALYQGQALTARSQQVRDKMATSAQEENDHLAWCSKRLTQLGSRPSLLNPICYAGSFTLGAVAGWAGDRWSLGFVVETERQVVRHLEEHLSRLPQQDHPTRTILEVMKKDELHHATTALNAGAEELPDAVKITMKWMSKVMTSTVYHI